MNTSRHGVCDVSVRGLREIRELHEATNAECYLVSSLFM
jgi:hypothetical protein